MVLHLRNKFFPGNEGQHTLHGRLQFQRGGIGREVQGGGGQSAMLTSSICASGGWPTPHEGKVGICTPAAQGRSRRGSSLRGTDIHFGEPTWDTSTCGTMQGIALRS